MRTVLLMCVAAACLWIPIAGAAPPPALVPVGMQTDGQSFWSGAVVPDKTAYAGTADAAVAALAPASTVTGASLSRTALSGSKSVGVAGSTVDVRFNDNHNIHRGWTSFCVTFDNGTSSTHWFGATPFNAKHLQYTQRWTYTGIGISIHVPGGVDFSGSGDTIKWTHGYSTLWMASHNYSGIEGCVGVLGIMYNVSEQHSGDWQVTATAGALVQANASAGVI